MPLSLAWRLDPIVRLVYRLKGPAHIQTRLNTLSAVATRGVCEGCRMCEVGRLGPAAALAIVQGKYILIFEVLKRLRAFQNLFFTEGVVTGNGCCNLLRPLP